MKAVCLQRPHLWQSCPVYFSAGCAAWSSSPAIFAALFHRGCRGGKIAPCVGEKTGGACSRNVPSTIPATMSYFTRALLGLYESRDSASKYFEKVIAVAPKSQLAFSSKLWIQSARASRRSC